MKIPTITDFLQLDEIMKLPRGAFVQNLPEVESYVDAEFIEQVLGGEDE